MSFSGNEDHSISLDEAVKLTERYRTQMGSGATLGGYFSKRAVEGVLKQDGCVGIRIYCARGENGSHPLVVVGVDTAGDDLEGGELAERSILCPPRCGLPNRLNS